MNYLKTLRLIIFFIPILGISQYSKIEKSTLTLFSPTLLSDSIKVQNLNLELIRLSKKDYMIDQLGGYVFELDKNELIRIDNSYQHKMQLGSKLMVQNDTIFRHGGYGFWETRSLLTFYDFNSNEWEIVKTKTSGPKKYGHLGSSNDKELIFYGGYLNNESRGVSDKKSNSVYSFNLDDREWFYEGNSQYHFSNRDKIITIENERSLVLNKDTLFLIDPFQNKIELFKSNSFLNKIVSNSKLKSFYKDSVFYFINKIHSTNSYEINKRGYSEILSNPIGEIEFINKENVNYFWFLPLSILNVVFIYLFRSKSGSDLKILIVVGNKTVFKGKSIQLTNEEKRVLLCFTHTNKTSNKDLIESIGKNELNYNHQLRILNNTVKDLNNKFNVLLDLKNPLIMISKSSLDKRVRVFILNENVSIRIKNQPRYKNQSD